MEMFHEYEVTIFFLFSSLSSLSLSRHELIELVYFADVGREFLAFRDNSL